MAANMGYLFQRDYYLGIKDDVLSDTTKDKKKQKSFFCDKNYRLIENSMHSYDDCEIGDGFRLKTIYPGLITGIGMVHETGMMGEFKLGMAFDFSTGYPVIHGSSVKGLLRSMFPILNTGQKLDNDARKALFEEKKNYIASTIKEIVKNNDKYSDVCDKIILFTNEESTQLAESIFCGKRYDGDFLSIYERDIFYDAQIVGDYSKMGILGFDYITPHPDPLKNPNPIQFLKILPNVELSFCFKLNETQIRKSDGTQIRVPKELKLELFKKILTTVGIGAKTNVGYGQLSVIKEK